jgi:hypothetical protein
MLTLQSSVGIGLAIYMAGLLALCIIRIYKDSQES